jgi:hypothetical protein
MEEIYKLYEMFGKKMFKKFFKKEKKVLKEVVVEEKVFEKKDFVYKKKEIDLNNIDFPISPRFQIFLDMVRDE